MSGQGYTLSIAAIGVDMQTSGIATSPFSPESPKTPLETGSDRLTGWIRAGQAEGTEVAPMTREQMEAIAERAVIWAHAARAWDVGAPGVAPKTALDDLRDEVWEALGWSETEEQDSTELAREEYAVAVGAAGYTG